MNVTTISRSLLGGLLSAIVILQPASAAGTLSGQIGVQVTLGSGCSVSNVRNGENNRWGNINFGSYGDSPTPLMRRSPAAAAETP